MEGESREERPAFDWMGIFRLPSGKGTVHAFFALARFVAGGMAAAQVFDEPFHADIGVAGSRELSTAAGPWDERLTLDDDGEYFCRVVLASERIRFVPGNNVFYRKGANSLSVIGHSNKKLESQLLSIRLQAERLGSFDRTMKAALVKYLQSYMILFYPNRPDLVNTAQEIARSFGGQLGLPTLPWKYALVQKMFGWQAAKTLQIRGNRFKANILEAWDKALFALQSRDTNHAA